MQVTRCGGRSAAVWYWMMHPYDWPNVPTWPVEPANLSELNLPLADLVAARRQASPESARPLARAVAAEEAVKGRLEPVAVMRVVNDDRRNGIANVGAPLEPDRGHRT